MSTSHISPRNVTLSIVKAIGIILMVMGHAGCPGFLCTLLYEFHMPLHRCRLFLLVTLS